MCTCMTDRLFVRFAPPALSHCTEQMRSDGSTASSEAILPSCARVIGSCFFHARVSAGGLHALSVLLALFFGLW